MTLPMAGSFAFAKTLTFFLYPFMVLLTNRSYIK